MEANSSVNSSVDCGVILAHLPPFPLMEVTLKSVFCAFAILFCILTLSNNLLVIFIISKVRSLHVRKNIFIVSLAVADIGVATIIMPLRIYEQWNTKWELGQLACSAVNTLDALFCTASMMNIYGIALERYLSVCRPFLLVRLRYIICLITACWLAPFFTWGILLVSGWYLLGIEDVAACMLLRACRLTMNLASCLIVSLITFWIPAILSIVAYWKIYKTVHYHATAITKTIVSDEVVNPKKEVNSTKAATMLNVLVGCFLLCWTPFFIVLIVNSSIGFRVPSRLKVTVMWLGYCNSAMNPIIYYNFSSRFKAAFRSIFKRFSPLSPVRISELVTS